MNITGNFQLESPGPDVMVMDKAYFPHPWTPDQWQELNPETHSLFTLRENSRLIAFALFGTLKGDDAAHLYKIIILPERRGEGTIPHFWNSLVLELKKSGFKSCFLEVEASNLQAIGFYQKVGFQTLRRNKGYYSNGEDALIMTVTL